MSARRPLQLRLLFTVSFEMFKMRKLTDDILSAEPKIVELVLQRKFYLCIIFRIKGIPYANTTWLKDGKPLVISNEHYKHYTIPTQGAQADGKGDDDYIIWKL